MAHDDWMTAALNDDGALVAELLLNLRRSSSYQLKNEINPASTLTWRVRQPRSKPMSAQSSDKKRVPSPTTPLSYSGGTSVTVDEFSSPLTGSKGLDARENAGLKKSKKKKTLAELKEDEVLFLKERRDLKKKLASLRATVEKERSMNYRLKRMKLDCVSLSAKRVILPAPTDESSKMVPFYNTFSADLRINENTSVEQLCLSNPEPDEDNQFMLPDLNIAIEDLTAGNL